MSKVLIELRVSALRKIYKKAKSDYKFGDKVQTKYYEPHKRVFHKLQP